MRVRACPLARESWNPPESRHFANRLPGDGSAPRSGCVVLTMVVRVYIATGRRPCWHGPGSRPAAAHRDSSTRARAAHAESESDDTPSARAVVGAPYIAATQ